VRAALALALALAVALAAGCSRRLTCADAAARLATLEREERARLGRPPPREPMTRTVLQFTRRCAEELPRDAEVRARLCCVMDAATLSVAQRCLKGF
jgi:hypothetical protein